MAKKNIDNLIADLAPDMEAVNQLILHQLDSQSPLTQKIANHLVSSGGKRLRPLTVLASAYLGGINQIEPAQKMAAAIELMHTATLLHDDVVDESDKRRNLPTAHTLWGNPAAILVGDFLLGRAFEMMVDVGSLEALKILSRAAAIIAEGEVMQLHIQNTINIKKSDIMNIIAAKTASLFAAATETGTILAGGSSQQKEDMRQYGYYLGMAFQLMDDAFDYDGASIKFGKAAGNDFFEGKMTLPVILCCQQANGAERNFWQHAMENPAQSKPSDFKKACALMKKYQTLQATQEYAFDYALKAKNHLQHFPPNDRWRQGFEDIADFCVNRDF